MINFFRKKRKKMADDNKALKYTRYAIGEIVLVVIGILIALSINNWNEHRKIKNEEQVLISQLLEDAKADFIFFTSRTYYSKVHDTLYYNLNNLYINHKVDSISALKMKRNPFGLNLAYQSNLINNNPNAYDLLLDKAIKTKLREYYSKYDYVSSAIKMSNNTYDKYGTPLKIKYFKELKEIRNDSTVGSFKEIIQDKDVMAYISILRNVNFNTTIQVDDFLEVNQELIQLLKTYLNEHQ